MRSDRYGKREGMANWHLGEHYLRTSCYCFADEVLALAQVVAHRGCRTYLPNCLEETSYQYSFVLRKMADVCVDSL